MMATKEAIARACAEYYKRNRKELLTQKRGYYQKNKDEILKKQKERRDKFRKPRKYADNYRAIHKWARRNVPQPKNCTACGKRKVLEIANLSGDYKHEISDYIWICHSCHQRKHKRGQHKNNKFGFDKIKRRWVMKMNERKDLIPVLIESEMGHDTLEVPQAQLPDVVAEQLQQDKYATVEHNDGSTEILTANDLPAKESPTEQPKPLNAEPTGIGLEEPTDEEAEIAALLNEEVKKEEATAFQKKLGDAKSVQVTNKAKGG